MLEVSKEMTQINFIFALFLKFRVHYTMSRDKDPNILRLMLHIEHRLFENIQSPLRIIDVAGF